MTDTSREAVERVVAWAEAERHPYAGDTIRALMDRAEKAEKEARRLQAERDAERAEKAALADECAGLRASMAATFEQHGFAIASRDAARAEVARMREALKSITWRPTQRGGLQSADHAGHRPRRPRHGGAR